jgi:hypothetical protein
MYHYNDVVLKEIGILFIILLPISLLLLLGINLIIEKRNSASSNTDLLSRIPGGDLRLIWLERKKKGEIDYLDELPYEKLIELLDACIKAAESTDKQIFATEGEKREKLKETLRHQVRDILDIKSCITLINEAMSVENLISPPGTKYSLDSVQYNNGEYAFIYTYADSHSKRNGGMLKRNYNIEFLNISSITIEDVHIKWMSLKDYAQWDKDYIKEKEK